MNADGFRLGRRRQRLLVALCSHGSKNLPYLKRIIQTYQHLPLDVDIVVLSDTEKELGAGVRVLVGAPSKNPWSLPFAHKQVFADNVDRYDLFAYSEDDIEFTAANLDAFLRVTPELGSEEIAGFLHYERDDADEVWMVCTHRHFHWKADSVRRRGIHWTAEFTNEHSAFYILTQEQLGRAIASGGFLREPYEGKYDMLCTAATDPYTSCGFRKVICISALDDFLVHHLPDKYIDELDVPLSDFREQVRALIEVGEGRLPNSNLFNMETRLGQFAWMKSYYEKADSELLELIPDGAKTALSVGCGWGGVESELVKRGIQVAALPLDAVIGSVAARTGIEVICGTWDDCLKALGSRQFDCVLLPNLLHLQSSPEELVERCALLVHDQGALVVSGPNFGRLPWLIKRVLGIGEFRKLRSFELGGIRCCGPRFISKSLQGSGMRMAQVRWLDHDSNQRWINGTRLRLGSATARAWAVQALRQVGC